MSHQDKAVERIRYDKRAVEVLGRPCEGLVLGSTAMPAYLAAPYHCFEELAAEIARPAARVLEVGAGTGMHSLVWLQAGAHLVATDIAPNSLLALQKAARSSGYVCETHVADMEMLPFPDSSFDCVASAGALSYGDVNRVCAEILRVLKPGGVFLCVDSLNHNLIYRFNRYLHFLRGNRSRSTLARMPSLKTIQIFRNSFGEVKCNFFGAFSWVGPLLSAVIGEVRAAKALDRLDRSVSVRRSAFKFVMKATKPSIFQ